MQRNSGRSINSETGDISASTIHGDPTARLSELCGESGAWEYLEAISRGMLILMLAPSLASRVVTPSDTPPIVPTFR